MSKKSEMILSQKDYVPVHLRVAQELERRQKKIQKLKDQKE